MFVEQAQIAELSSELFKAQCNMYFSSKDESERLALLSVALDELIILDIGASLMEPSAIDFSATLRYIVSTIKLLALTITKFEEAKHLATKLKQLLSDQQASAEYVPLYCGFLDVIGIIASRFTQLCPDVLQVIILIFAFCPTFAHVLS